MSSVKHWQGSYSFILFKFHNFPWLFHDLINFSMTSGLETVPKTKTLVSTKKHAVHASLYLVLALSSRVTNLPNKTLNFHDFPGLGNEILKFHDFPDFPLPVRCWFVSKNLACGWALMANIIIFIPKGVKHVSSCQSAYQTHCFFMFPFPLLLSIIMRPIDLFSLLVFSSQFRPRGVL